MTCPSHKGLIQSGLEIPNGLTSGTYACLKRNVIHKFSQCVGKIFCWNICAWLLLFGTLRVNSHLTTKIGMMEKFHNKSNQHLLMYISGVLKLCLLMKICTRYSGTSCIMVHCRIFFWISEDNSPLGTIPHWIKIRPKYCPPGPRSLGQLPTRTTTQTSKTTHQDQYLNGGELSRYGELGFSLVCIGN